MHFHVFLLYGLFILLNDHLNTVNCKEDNSYNYIFDYVTNIEVKVGEKEYASLLNYTGQVETSPYILTDNQELILVKLDVNKCNALKTNHKGTGIIIRRRGLVERLIVDNAMEIGVLNLFKGIVNLFNIDEMRKDKVEADVNGECDVKYEIVKEDLLVKVKSGCNKTTFYSSIPEMFDSFSIHQDSKIKLHYQFNNDGALVAVNSLETHLLESVISEELSQTFKSTSALLLKTVTKSQSIIDSGTVDTVVKNVFGENHRQVFLIAIPEIGYNEPVIKELFLEKYRQILNSLKEEKRAQKTIELIMLLRRVTERSLLKMVIDEKHSKEVMELLHDAFIGCSTKLCSDLIIIELDHMLIENQAEASRMMLLMQHVSRTSELMVKELWARLPNLSNILYDQALQTISSMVERMANTEHMKSFISAVVTHIENKLTACTDDLCFQVHLSAIRNTKLSIFHKYLLELLSKCGKLPNNVIASVYNSLCFLNYDENTKVKVKQSLLETVRREINLYVDDRVKYEAIFSLVRLESDIEDVVSILDSLQDSSDHLNVFIASKIRELIKMGIIGDGERVLGSKFFRKQWYQSLMYKDESKMLVNQLASTKTLFSDIHFNVIGQDGGVVRNSMTDIFLVSTARENHLLSLATHINGLQSVAGTGGGSSDEVVEGLLQLILFGKEARPVQLFQGTSDLMSTLWYAPTSLQSLLSGTFVPIDLQREIVFQNGVVLSLTYFGSTYIDFSFKLNSNLWYKTADSLIRVSGQAYISMLTRIKSLTNLVNHTQSLSISSGLDFDTNIDFSESQVKNCLSVSRFVSRINVTTVEHSGRVLRRSNALTDLQGGCYSLSTLSNQLCSTF